MSIPRHPIVKKSIMIHQTGPKGYVPVDFLYPEFSTQHTTKNKRIH